MRLASSAAMRTEPTLDPPDDDERGPAPEEVDAAAVAAERLREAVVAIAVGCRATVEDREALERVTAFFEQWGGSAREAA